MRRNIWIYWRNGSGDYVSSRTSHCTIPSLLRYKAITIHSTIDPRFKALLERERRLYEEAEKKLAAF